MSDAETLTLGAFAQRLADDAEFRGQFVVAARESGVAHDVAEALLVMTADPPDEMEIDLRSPILAEGLDTPIGKLKLREPTAGEMIKLHGKIGIERVLELVFLQTGAPLSALRRLKQRDLTRAIAYYDLFS